VATEKLSRDQIELVLRRAAEMDAQREAGAAPGPGEGELSPPELVRLGREAGLRPDTIMRALAELRRGALATPEGDTLDKLWGPGQIVISREIPGPPEPIQRAVERFMRRQLMTVRRHYGERVEWERARGLFPGLARSLDFAQRYAFGPVGAVETLVVPETSDSSSVTFRIDISELRRGRLAGVAARGAVAFGLIGLGGAALFPGFGINDVMALVAGGAAAGGLSALERRRFQMARDRIALEPERFLDLLVQRRLKAVPGQPERDERDDDEP
jgi:hypothetical protein